MDSSLESLLCEAREELVRWGKHEKGLGEVQLGYLLDLLNREHLLSLPCSSKVEKHDTPEGIRHLFYHHVSNILGWKERVPEGDSFGISPLLYNLVRQIWPSQHHGNNKEQIHTIVYRNGTTGGSGRGGQQHSGKTNLTMILHTLRFMMIGI